MTLNNKLNYKSSNKNVRKISNKELSNNIDILTLNIKNNNANLNAMNDLLNKLIKIKKKINEIRVKKREKANKIIKLNFWITQWIFVVLNLIKNR